jgi:hypothetical protein
MVRNGRQRPAPRASTSVAADRASPGEGSLRGLQPNAQTDPPPPHGSFLGPSLEGAQRRQSKYPVARPSLFRVNGVQRNGYQRSTRACFVYAAGAAPLAEVLEEIVHQVLGFVLGVQYLEHVV